LKLSGVSTLFGLSGAPSKLVLDEMRSVLFIVIVVVVLITERLLLDELRV